MRRALLALLLLLLTASLAHAGTLGWAAVWRSEDALARVSLTGRVRTMITMEGKPREAAATVSAAQGKLRLDYTARDRHWSLLDDGQHLIRLGGSDRRARVLPRPTLAFDRALAERNYNAHRTTTGTIAGRPVQVVEIAPRGHGGPVWRLWLDRETGFPLKRERYNAEGKLTTATEFVSVRFGAHPNPDLFAVPPGFTREEEEGTGARLTFEQLASQAGFEVHRCDYLPSGYVFLGGYLRAGRQGKRRNEGGPGKVAELRYTDGLRLLSVVQRPVAGGDTGRREVMDVADRGTEKVLRYHTNGRALIVVGDLTQEELVRVAKGVG